MTIPVKDFLEVLKANRINFYDPQKPLYKYVDIKTAKLILENKTLRFKVAKYFNDPFELSEDYFDFDITYRDMRTHLKSLFMRTYPDISEEDALKNARKFDRKYVIDSYQKMLKNWKEDYLMFCTSKSNTKTLMWSHYADSHQGICLGLIIPPYMEWENKVDQFSLCVRYTEVIEQMNFFDTFSDSDKEPVWAFKWLLSKSTDWAYEDEVRSIICDPDRYVRRQDGIHFDMPFNSGSLKEVYFGLRTSEKDINDIVRVLDHNGYKLESIGKMEMEKGAYRLKVESLSK